MKSSDDAKAKSNEALDARIAALATLDEARKMALSMLAAARKTASSRIEMDGFTKATIGALQAHRPA